VLKQAQMETDLVELVRQAILSGIVVIAPVLVVGFIVGTVAGLVQAATGVHEQIVGLVPRMAAMAAMLLLSLPWMVERLVEFFRAAAGGP
jgi:flagellar biosynthetic protein FliQ